MKIMVISTLAAIFVQQLGSPVWHERERATMALRKLLPASEQALIAACQSEDTEIRARATSILQNWRIETAQHKANAILPDNYPVLPWIDGMPGDSQSRYDTVNDYLKMAQDKVGNGGPPDWKDYRYATWLWVFDQFCNGESTAAVKGVLNKMRDSELRWYKDNGHRYTPALNPPVDLPK